MLCCVCLTERENISYGGNSWWQGRWKSPFSLCFLTSRMRENGHFIFKRYLLYFFVSYLTSLNCVRITFLWKLLIITYCITKLIVLIIYYCIRLNYLVGFRYINWSEMAKITSEVPNPLINIDSMPRFTQIRYTQAFWGT